MHLLPLVERHLRNTGIAPSRFGRDAVNDPSFVSALRAGCVPTRPTVDRVVAHIHRHYGQDI